MGIITSSGGSGSFTWSAVQHGQQQLCTNDRFTPIPAASRWVVPNIVDFAPWNGSMTVTTTTAPDSRGRPVTGGLLLSNRYCNNQHSAPSSPGGRSYVTLEARFGTAAGQNTPHARVSFLVFVPNSFSEVRVTYHRRNTNYYLSTPPLTQHAALGWHLYSYADPCHPVDKVTVTAELVQGTDILMHVTNFAWDGDAIFDANVNGNSMIWQGANGIVVAVPRFCIPEIIRSIPARITGWSLAESNAGRKPDDGHTTDNDPSIGTL